MEDIQIALGYLRDLPDVRVDGVGLLGFCGGGVLKRKTAPFVLGRPSSVRCISGASSIGIATCVPLCV